MDRPTMPLGSQPRVNRTDRGLFASLSRWWDGGLWHKVGLLAAIPTLLSCVCCSGGLIFAATPAGQQFAREADATATAQAFADAQATATAIAYIRLHPSPTPSLERTAVPTVTKQSTIPTPRPTPTATLLPTISLSKPILGGSWQAFDNLFGDNNCCYRNGWDYQGPFGPTWTGVTEAGTYTSQPDNLSARVISVDTQPTQQPAPGLSPYWSLSQELAMQAQFMPPDAKLIGAKPIYLGNLNVASEKTYTSALLGRTLPASDFKDAHGNAAPSGTFYVYLAYNDTDQTEFTHCLMGTNEADVLATY